MPIWQQSKEPITTETPPGVCPAGTVRNSTAIFKATTICCECKRHISTTHTDVYTMEAVCGLQLGSACRSEFCTHYQGLCCRQPLLELSFDCSTCNDSSVWWLNDGFWYCEECETTIDSSFVRNWVELCEGCYERLDACWTDGKCCVSPPTWNEGRRDPVTGEIRYTFNNQGVPDTEEMEARYKEEQALRSKLEAEVRDLKRKVEKLEQAQNNPEEDAMDLV